jgi:uncharacterized repeat protein (TIGR02543 family)
MIRLNKRGIGSFIAVGALITAAIAGVFMLVLTTLQTKSYRVSFDTYTETIIESQNVKENELVERPKDPTKEGYKFTGWYLDNEKFDFNTKVKSSFTLKAHYEKMAVEDKSLEDNTGVTSVSVEENKIELKINETKRVKYKVLPDTALNQYVTFASSNPSAVTVDNNGLITAVSEGTSIIVVSSLNNKTAYITVTVLAEEVEEEAEPEATEEQPAVQEAQPTNEPEPNPVVTPAEPTEPTEPQVPEPPVQQPVTETPAEPTEAEAGQE